MDESESSPNGSSSYIESRKHFMPNTMKENRVNSEALEQGKQGHHCDLFMRRSLIHASNAILIVFIQFTLALNAYCKLNKKKEEWNNFHHAIIYARKITQHGTFCSFWCTYIYLKMPWKYNKSIQRKLNKTLREKAFWTYQKNRCKIFKSFYHHFAYYHCLLI